MGDRGNIIVKYNEDIVYLYTHWGGSELYDVLKRALSRKERWNDPSYLTRIIFCEMVKDDVEGSTGYGISSTAGDGGTDIIVDVAKQTVQGQSFEEFIGEVKE
ncbi:MAG: hypothetical protein Unbinned1693contig1002_33 [Prokaryotic dsDNA virus sp.]|jgi:hypothetical protein|nr:MAG: hypothetical protein Unbinned1693contig1002_33 [Prokaryotic dsDNA virus sp.]|tara:strand:+ start:5584 stop:5892 length:309 start_codon:yes stop_codon:yes gene_type:complete